MGQSEDHNGEVPYLPFSSDGFSLRVRITVHKPLSSSLPMKGIARSLTGELQPGLDGARVKITVEDPYLVVRHLLGGPRTTFECFREPTRNKNWVFAGFQNHSSHQAKCGSSCLAKNRLWSKYRVRF